MFLADFYQMFLADMKMMWLHYIWLLVQILHVFCFVSAGWNAGVQAGYLLPENETPLRTDFDEITDISYFSTLFHCMQLNSFFHAETLFFRSLNVKFLSSRYYIGYLSFSLCSLRTQEICCIVFIFFMNLNKLFCNANIFVFCIQHLESIYMLH